jgi:hypothetical protein
LKVVTTPQAEKHALRDRRNAACRSNVTVAFFRWIDVSPTDFILETEPRHEQATARRMLMPLQERQVLLLKSSGSMVFDLILDEWLQSSRWDEAIFLMIPGTSCLALSLRDKNIRPSKRRALS